MNQILADEYQLSFAANSIKAMDVVKKTNPDLILLDIMMPGMDGYDVCRQLKASSSFKKNTGYFLYRQKMKLKMNPRGFKIGSCVGLYLQARKTRHCKGTH